jgi:hypothetical protein
MKQSLPIILLLLFTVACGKKVVKKSAAPEDFAPAFFTDDIEFFMPQVKSDFNNQMIYDYFQGDAEVVFVQMNLATGKDNFLGKTFSSQTANAYCSHSFIRPNDEILLTSSEFVSCSGPTSATVVEHEGNYDLGLVPELAQALNTTPDRIVLREVTYKGETYQGYGLQKDSNFQLSKSYKETVIIPDFPLILNPVLTYDSLTGQVKALEGIQVR